MPNSYQLKRDPMFLHDQAHHIIGSAINTFLIFRCKRNKVSICVYVYILNRVLMQPMLAFVRYFKVFLTHSKTLLHCLLDRASHFEVPLRLVGYTVPAAQAGGGRAISTAARRPILPRVCRLHLQVVSIRRHSPPLSCGHGCPPGGSVDVLV